MRSPSPDLDWSMTWQGLSQMGLKWGSLGAVKVIGMSFQMVIG
jgi:hypothetical protein